jgi:L-iditol 2-dehydrogenase
MTGKMKANVFYEPFNMKVEEVDIPQISDNEVLVKVKSVGICGSDIAYYYGTSPVGTATGKGPLILGHETAGIVEEVGVAAAAIGLKKGDRVCVNPVSPCFSCVHCMNAEYNECDNLQNYGVNVNGAFAEYMKAAVSNVYKIPDEMSFEEAGLAEPLACATYSAKRLEVQLGQTAVVIGCGAIGLMDVQLVRAAGAGKVIAVDVDDIKLEKALAVGANHVFNTFNKDSKYYTEDIAQSVRDVNGGRLAHRALVPTGAMAAWQQALEVTGGSSIIVYFGLPASPDMMLQIPGLSAITLNRQIRFSWLSLLTWDNVFHLVASGQVKLDSIITHRFGLDNLVDGIRFMKESKEEKIKGVLLID